MQTEQITKLKRSFGRGSTCCPVCVGSETTSIRPVFDDRYGCPDMFFLVRCNTCGHIMTYPSLLEDELASLYSTYYPRKHVVTPDLVAAAKKVVSPLAGLHRWWSGTNNQGQYTVSRGECMLDVGCGSGLSLLEAERLGAQAYGIEADPNIQRIADELGLRVHIGSLHDQPFPGVRFDLIVLNQVIEHIPDPGVALVALKERLKLNGRIVLVFPNRRSLWQKLSRSKWINWHIPYHLHHFDANGFKVFVQRHGFKVIRLKTITPNVWSILQLRIMRQAPEPGISSAIWEIKASAAVASRNPRELPHPSVLRVARGMLKQMAFFSLAVLNRLLDAIGQGDSIMVELQIEDMS